MVNTRKIHMADVNKIISCPAFKTTCQDDITSEIFLPKTFVNINSNSFKVNTINKEKLDLAH